MEDIRICKARFGTETPAIKPSASLASKCKRALIRPTTSPTKAMTDILGRNTVHKNSFMKDGFASDSEIIQKYTACKGASVAKCGFFISEKYPFLGATPDGLVGSDGLIGVRKLHPNDNKSLEKALLRQIICKQKVDKLVVNDKQRYFFQVQQLLCTQRLWGDFVASDGKSLYIHRIKYDEDFWDKKIVQLEKSYNDTILLELAYSCVQQGLDM